MTTAMSTAHEIKYTIFVYIAEAAKANASARANGKEVTVIGANGSDSSKTATANKKNGRGSTGDHRPGVSV